MDDQPELPEEPPLGDNEREALKSDLLDVESLKALLGPRGIRGAVFYCPDCDEDHFLGWDLLAGNLTELLQEGESPVHEPAFNPNPDEYVSWDYARGFLDGYETYGEEEVDEIADRLRDELGRKGWTRGDVTDLLTRLDIDSTTDDEPSGGDVLP